MSDLDTYMMNNYVLSRLSRHDAGFQVGPSKSARAAGRPARINRKLLSAVFLLGVSVAAAAQQRSFRGITEPYKDATLSASVAGTVLLIPHKEGESVKAGAIILELEREAESLEVERRRLISESKVEVDAARHRLEALKINLEATRQLFEATRSVSEEELQEKELETRLAQAELERLLTVEEREEIEYRIARAQLEKRIIRAPFSGIIVKIFLETGENCNSQAPLVRIADCSRCRLIVHLEAAASRQLNPEMDVRIRIDGVSNPSIFQGVIEYISPVVDPSSGLREVKVLFDNSDSRVKPGMSGTLLIG